MIVADTSALAAILLKEHDSHLYATALFGSSRTLIGAPTAFELRIVIERKLGYDLVETVDTLLAQAQIEIVAWTADHLALADEALRRFGGRPASLNYGDCMAYAVAKALDAPLLYRGNDFSRTDIRSAL